MQTTDTNVFSFGSYGALKREDSHEEVQLLDSSYVMLLHFSDHELSGFFFMHLRS